MREPVGLGSEYDFPTDVSRLTSNQLGTLRLQLSAWYSWTLKLLGDEESDITAIETAYNMALGVRMHEIAQGYEKNKPVKETLMALAIKSDDRLAVLTRTLTEKRMMVRRLAAQADVYKGQLSDLSREQSRRENEQKAYGSG